MEIPDLFLVETAAYLLPGFVAAWVFYGFTAHPRKTPFERGVQALIFTALIFPIKLMVRGSMLWMGQTLFCIGVWSSEVELGVSTVIGLLFGVAMSVCANLNFPHGFVPDWVTKRTSSPSEWHSTFKSEKRYIYLHLKGGRRLYGWPFEWPDHPDCGHFVIVEAKWVLNDNTQVPLYATQKLLIPVTDVEMVEFVFWDEEIESSEHVIDAAERVLVSLHQDVESESSQSIIEKAKDTLSDNHQPHSIPEPKVNFSYGKTGHRNGKQRGKGNKQKRKKRRSN